MKKALFLALCAIFTFFILVSCAPADVEDTGERVSGKYVWSISVGISMESSWTFEGSSVTVSYHNGLDYVEQTYDYVIGIKDGVKVIKLYYPGDGFVSFEYDFEYGEGYVIIAGEFYEAEE